MLGFRAVCEETWGTEVYERTVALLPSSVRDATAGLRPIEEWVDERYIIAWADAVWRGPARQDEALMRRFVAAMMAFGFGRVRRFFLQRMTPETLIPRTPGIWRQEHTTGILEAESVRPGLVYVRLSDHPYLDSPLTRLAIAESIRFATSLTRAKNVTEKHASYGRPLRVDIAWDGVD